MHYVLPCPKPEIKTPLYKENYLQEFTTESEKAEARRSLGLYNYDDVVALSLLSTKDIAPTLQEIQKVSTKQMHKANEFFAPFTIAKAVYTETGDTLDRVINSLNEKLNKQTQDIVNIMQVSNSKELTSLGDITKFLQGFNNGDNLCETIDLMNQEMLRFETTDKITF